MTLQLYKSVVNAEVYVQCPVIMETEKLNKD